MVSFNCSYASCTRAISWMRSLWPLVCRCMGSPSGARREKIFPGAGTHTLDAREGPTLHSHATCWNQDCETKSHPKDRPICRRSAPTKLPKCFPLQPEDLLLAQEPRERLAVDAQRLGRPGLVAARLAKDALGIRARQLLEGGVTRRQRVHRGGGGRPGGRGRRGRDRRGGFGPPPPPRLPALTHRLG